MKVLVVYYSFEGNSRFIARAIAEQTGADILEIKPADKILPDNFFKYALGGKKVIRGEKPKLMNFEKNPQDYDLLFIGTPVWAWNYSSPLHTFFSEVKLLNKKIALFCCHRGNKGKTLENMRRSLSGNTILGEIDFQDPLHKEKEENEKKARKWADDIVNS